jgi:hypothetical protein
MTFKLPPMTRTRAILLGGLTVAALDALDALVFFTGILGVPAMRPFQAIAAGLMGRAAFQGGASTLLLGLALHLFNATCIVAVYVLVSGKLSLLTRRPLVCGGIYGLLVYGVMNFIVIPLSALEAHVHLPGLINGLIVHSLFVGPPSALFARAAAPAITPPAPGGAGTPRGR